MGVIKKLYGGRVTKAEGESIHEILTGKDNLPIGVAVAVIKESKLHYHKNTMEWYIILEGTAEITLNYDKVCAEKHTLIFIEPNTKHMVKRIGMSRVKILVITSPPWTENDHYVIV